jgi:hypothetical protein
MFSKSVPHKNVVFAHFVCLIVLTWNGKFHGGGQGLNWAVEPETKKCTNSSELESKWIHWECPVDYIGSQWANFWWEIRTSDVAPALESKSLMWISSDCILFKICTRDQNRNSSVGIATGYGMDYLGGWSSSLGRVKNFYFSISSRPALGYTQPPIKWVPLALSRG